LKATNSTCTDGLVLSSAGNDLSAMRSRAGAGRTAAGRLAFTITGGKITGIDLIADSDSFRDLDLVAQRLTKPTGVAARVQQIPVSASGCGACRRARPSRGK